jgi:hypothetical protein
MYAICAEDLEERSINASGTTTKSQAYRVWVDGQERLICRLDLLVIAARFGNFNQSPPTIGIVGLFGQTRVQDDPLGWWILRLRLRRMGLGLSSRPR